MGDRRLAALVAAACVAGCGGGQEPRPAPTPAADTPPGAAEQAPAPERLPPGVAAAVRTPGFPVGIAFGHGSVWVSSHRGTTLYRIDPARNRVQARIDVGRESCGRVQATATAVWVTSCEDGPSTRVDPRTDQAVETTDTGVLPPLTAGGSTWRVEGSDRRGRLVGRNPRTRAVTARIPLGSLAGHPLLAFGALWVASAEGTIARVDAATGRARTVVLGEADTDLLLARAGGAVWAADGTNGTLWRISPEGRARRSLLRVRPPSLFFDIGLAAGRGHLFLRSGDTQVLQVDPRSQRIVARHPATGAGGHVGVGFGSLWVVNAGDDSVWRIRLP